MIPQQERPTVQPPLAKTVACQSCHKRITYESNQVLIVPGGLTRERTTLICSCGQKQTWERTPDE